MGTPAWMTAEALSKAANDAKGKQKKALQKRLNDFLLKHPEI